MYTAWWKNSSRRSRNNLQSSRLVRMLERSTFCWFVLGVAACAQTAPDGAEQSAVISQMREAARAYVQNLPNFICAQVTQRKIELVVVDSLAGVKESGAGRTGLSHISAGRPESTDTFEEQLAYFEHQENYQLVKV